MVLGFVWYWSFPGVGFAVLVFLAVVVVLGTVSRLGLMLLSLRFRFLGFGCVGIWDCYLFFGIGFGVWGFAVGTWWF